MPNHALSIRRVREIPRDFRALSLSTIGLVLVAAAILKLLEFLTVNSETPVSARTFTMLCLAMVELAVGVLFIVGKKTASTYLLGAVTMFFLSCASGWMVISGWKICGCFGFLAIEPIYTLCFDLLAFASLIYGRIGQVDFSKMFGGVTFVLMLLSVFAIAFNGWRAHVERPAYEYSGSQELPSLPDYVYGLLPNIRPVVGGHRQITTPDSWVEYDDFPAAFEFLTGGSVLKKVSLPEIKEKVSNGHCVFVQMRDGTYSVIIGLSKSEGSSFWEVLRSYRAPDLWPEDRLIDSVEHAWEIAEGSSQVSHNGKLCASHSLVRFGIPKAGSTVQKSVVLSNGTSARITLDNVRVSCGCVHANIVSASRDLEAGGSIELELALDVGYVSLRQSVDVYYSIDGKPEEVPLRIELVASQVPSGEAVPSRLDFGVLEGSTRRTIRLSQSIFDPFEVVDIDVGNLPIRHSIREKTQANMFLKDYLLDCEITADEGLSKGKHEGVIKIKTSGKHRQDWLIPAEYEVQ